MIADYLKFVEFEVTPIEESSYHIKDIKVANIKTKLYGGNLPICAMKDWTNYSATSKTIFETDKVKFNGDNKSDVEVKSKLNTDFEKNHQKVLKEVSEVVHHTPKYKKRGNLIKNGSIQALKFIGKQVKTGVEWVVDHPELVQSFLELCLAIHEERSRKRSVQNNYNSYYNYEHEYDRKQKYHFESKKEPETSHEYPETRKSPRAHVMKKRDTKEVYAVRGGTEDEREQLKKEHGLL